MFAMTEMEPGFGRESRSIKPGMGVLALIICVGFALWIVAALDRRSTHRLLSGEDD